MRLLEIRRDPLAHFLPTKVTPNGTFFCAAPPGLAPELAEMFMRPIFNILNAKKRATSPEKGANKRARLDKDGDEDVEQARRAGSQAPSVALGSEALHRGSVGPDMDFGGDAGMDMGMGMDDFQFDVDTGVGMDDMQALMDRERARSKSRLSTPAADGELFDEAKETYADMDCPIRVFDERPSQSQLQSQDEPVEQDGKGYSRNTVKALNIIRKELGPAGSAEKMMSFQEMTHKVLLFCSFVCSVSCDLWIFTFRHRAEPRLRFSSSFLSWELAIALKSRKADLTRILKFVRRINYGRDRGTRLSLAIFDDDARHWFVALLDFSCAIPVSFTYVSQLSLFLDV